MSRKERVGKKGKSRQKREIRDPRIWEIEARGKPKPVVTKRFPLGFCNPFGLHCYLLLGSQVPPETACFQTAGLDAAGPHGSVRTPVETEQDICLGLPWVLPPPLPLLLSPSLYVRPLRVGISPGSAHCLYSITLAEQLISFAVWIALV